MLSSAFIILLTVFSDNISYHCFNILLLLRDKDYIQILQQYHKTPTATISEERYDWCDVCVMLFHLCPFFKSVYLMANLYLKKITAI